MTTTAPDLPRTLEEIADVVGEAAALRLALKCGGTRVYVPHRPRKGLVLVDIVGLPAARALAAHYAGERLEIPRAHRLRSKRARIVREQGSNAEVARRLGCTERWVRAVRNDPDHRPQPTLFPLDDEA